MTLGRPPIRAPEINPNAGVALEHDITLIATVTVGLALAFLFGFVAQRFRLPPLVGYLLAGIVVGPAIPGFVADSDLAAQLAEIGIMLIMFGVGLHFSLADLMAVRRIVIPGAMVQIALATLLGVLIAEGAGWSLSTGLVLGLSVSVASTVVLLRALEGRNLMASVNGRIAVGWLIVEDLAMVLALVMLPVIVELSAASSDTATAGIAGMLLTLVVTLFKVGLFVVLAMFIGPRVMPWLLREVARTGSRELFTLAVLAIALGIAFIAAKLFGVSFALGAFFAGMVLNQSELSHKAASHSLPLQDAFGVLFFVSVGMLFDPVALLEAPWMAAAVLALIVIGKSVVAVGIVLLLGFPWSTAIMVAVALAQIGEFSFILGGLGMHYGLIDDLVFNLILAGALVSIMANPLMFLFGDVLIRWLSRYPRLHKFLESSRAPVVAKVDAEIRESHERVEAKQAQSRTFTPEELAAAFPLFAGLTSEQREVLVLHFQPQTAQPGERVIREGDAADALYLISSGEVEVTIEGRRLVTRGPGEFFGEMGLLRGGLRAADVTTGLQSICRAQRARFPPFPEALSRYPTAHRGPRDRARGTLASVCDAARDTVNAESLFALGGGPFSGTVRLHLFDRTWSTE